LSIRMMKRNTRTLALLLAALGGGCAITNQTPRLGRLRHVVLFKFKDGTAPEQVSVIEAKFSALPGRIASIVDFEWGKDVSVEDKADGFTHCFVVTFADAAGRAVYLPHAAHQEFVELLLPSLDKVLVIDYVANR
jgi:Stress responsive A/B Barrel Domain